MNRKASMATNNQPTAITKVATLALPTRETHIVANVWPGARGMLLFLAELNLAPQVRQEFLQTLNTEMERFWQQAKNSTETADGIIEKLALLINDKLNNYNKLPSNPLARRYQLILACLSGQQLAVSAIGQINAFVINNHKLINILISSSHQKTTRPNYLFDNLINGQLLAGESLLLATSTLTDYFSWERLRQLIASRPPGQALREIEKYLQQLKIQPPIGLICLKMSLAGEVETTGSSLNHLLQTKDQTASLLQPKLWSYLKNKLWRRKQAATAISALTTPTTTNKVEPTSWSASTSKTKPLSLIFNKLLLLIKNLAWLKNRESIKNTMAWWLESILLKVKRLPPTKRALLFLAIAIILAFSQSIVNLGKTKTRAADSDYYNQLVTQITEKQVAIENVLIYGDDAKAKLLLGEAQTLLLSLPRNSHSREEQWQALSQNLSLLAKRLQRLTQISQLTPWAQLPSPVNGQWLKLTLWGDKLTAVASNGQLLTLTADAKIETTITPPPELTGINLAIPLSNELLLINNQQTAIYNHNTKRISLLPQTLSIIDGSFYNNALYYLNADNHTIKRASKTPNGFASPTNWLRSAAGELRGAVALTVDGAIFVARPDGVEKFSRGLKQTFNLTPIDPPLTAVNYIYTANENDYLYLWENTNKRLVVYDKEGKLIIQLIIDALHNPSPAIDGQKKVLYLLENNTIYKLPIPTMP